MATTVVLAVCLDPTLPGAQESVLRSAGYFFIPANSIKEAIHHFKAGDFDLVLLGNDVPKENRERLISLIRATGSQVPVACIAGSPGHRDAIADATFEPNPCQLLDRMGDLLKSKSGTRSMPAILYNPAT